MKKRRDNINYLKAFENINIVRDLNTKLPSHRFFIFFSKTENVGKVYRNVFNKIESQ